PDISAWAAHPASMKKAAAASSLLLIDKPPCFSESICCSDAQILLDLYSVRGELLVVEQIDHSAMLYNIVAVCDRCGEVKILFDQKDGEALGFQPGNCAPDLLHDY